MFALVATSSSLFAQAEGNEQPETILATVQAPLTRESLNETRIFLGEMGHEFQYGNFQFRPDGKLYGVEISLRVGDVQQRQYVEFVNDDCTLKVTLGEGLKMEGC